MSEWKYIVRDGLPKENEAVLVYDHGAMYVAEFKGKYKESHSVKDGIGRNALVPDWESYDYEIHDPTPTHWCPIPKDPPKKERQYDVILETDWF